MPGESTYIRMLLEARATGIGAGRAEIRRIGGAMEQAIADLRRIARANPGTLTGDRAAGLSRELRDVFRALDTRLGQSGDATVRNLSREILGMQRDTAIAVATAFGQAPTAAFGAAFDRLNQNVLRALIQRRGGAARTYQSLITRNMADAAAPLDRLVEAGVLRGESIPSLSDAIEGLLRGRVPRGTAFDLDRLGGITSIESDARRIARSETMNTLREANRLGLIESGMVAGVTWTVNSAHAVEDDCDDLAEADDFGLGAGVYPPEEWPVAPHPNCGCYQGAVVMLDPEDWDLEP